MNTAQIKAKNIPDNHQPLRPLQVPGHGTNPDEVNQMPQHRLYLETSDVAAMSTLMYAMADLVGDIRLDVNTERIRISERIAKDNLFVSLTMKRDVFDKYECSGEMVFCFQPKVMYRFISRHQSNSVMIWDLQPGPVGQREKKRITSSTNGVDAVTQGNEAHFLRQTTTNYFLSVTIESTDKDIHREYNF
jgi:hypothetical protein